MKPTMSAPASIAASSNAGVLMPQILMMSGSAMGSGSARAGEIIWTEGEGVVGRTAGHFELPVQALGLAPVVPLVAAARPLRKPGGDAAQHDADQQHAENDEEQRHADAGCAQRIARGQR